MKIKQIILYICGLMLALFILTPVFWMGITSLKLEVDVAKKPLEFWPSHGWTLINYNYLFLGGELDPKLGYIWATPGVYVDIWTTFGNSIIISLACVIINIIAAGLGGYGLARTTIRGRDTIFTSLLITQMIPVAALIVPLYIMFKAIGIHDTLLALIMPYVAVQLPVSIWILRGFFENIPIEFEEAAYIDGASRLQTLVKVVLPLAVPGLAAVAVFSFLGAFGEFFMAMTLTSSISARPFTVTVSQFALEDNLTYAILCTVGTFSIIPSVVIAILFRKFLIQGLAAGGLKM